MLTTWVRPRSRVRSPQGSRGSMWQRHIEPLDDHGGRGLEPPRALYPMWRSHIALLGCATLTSVCGCARPAGERADRGPQNRESAAIKPPFQLTTQILIRLHFISWTHQLAPRKSQFPHLVTSRRRLKCSLGGGLIYLFCELLVSRLG